MRFKTNLLFIKGNNKENKNKEAEKVEKGEEVDKVEEDEIDIKSSPLAEI